MLACHAYATGVWEGGSIEVCDLWQSLTVYTDAVREGRGGDVKALEAETRRALQELSEAGLGEAITPWYNHHFRGALQDEVTCLQAALRDWDGSTGTGYTIMRSGFDGLHRRLTFLSEAGRVFGDTVPSLSEPIASMLFTDPCVLRGLQAYLDETLAMVERGVQPFLSDDEEVATHDPSVARQLADQGRKLTEMGLSKSQTIASACTALIRRKIDEQVLKCQGRHDTPLLGELLGWTDQAIVPWIDALLGIDPSIESHLYDKQPLSEDHMQQMNTLISWRTVVDLSSYTALAKLRCREFFDILVEYPETTPALADLKNCLSIIPDFYYELVSLARQQIERRLLHAGAKTEDVLQVYVNLLRAVDFLFPSQSRALDAFTSPTQAYLKMRKDGVSAFVYGLINDSSSPLAEVLHPELRSGRGDCWDSDDEVDDASPDPPAPVQRKAPRVPQLPGAATPLTPFRLPLRQKGQVHDTPPGPVKALEGSGRKRLDVLKRLVETFGNRESVVALYRGILADKLLLREDFDTEADLVVLELLKLRFGENTLQNCEVMIKDLSDSKRLCQAIAPKLPTFPGGKHVQPVKGSAMTALVLSKLFWPQLVTVPEFRPHPLIESMQAGFSKEYTTLKHPRALQWRSGLGCVRFTISIFADAAHREREEVEVTAPMVQATLLLHLVEAQTGGKGGLTAGELVELTGLREDAVVSKLTWWQGQQLVQLDGEVYKCVRSKSKETQTAAIQASIEMSEEAPPQSAAEAEESMQNEFIAEYINGILMNFGPTEVMDIENKLKQFMPDYVKTLPDLLRLLGKMVAEDKLAVQGTMYSLKS